MLIIDDTDQGGGAYRGGLINGSSTSHSDEGRTTHEPDCVRVWQWRCIINHHQIAYIQNKHHSIHQDESNDRRSPRPSATLISVYRILVSNVDQSEVSSLVTIISSSLNYNYISSLPLVCWATHPRRPQRSKERCFFQMIHR